MRQLHLDQCRIWRLTVAQKWCFIIGWGRIFIPDSERKANTTAQSAGCSVQPVVHPEAERRGGNEVGLEGNPTVEGRTAKGQQT